MYEFEIYREFSSSENAGWRWRMKAPNGEIVATSGEAYVSKWNAKRAIRSIARKIPVVADD